MGVATVRPCRCDHPFQDAMYGRGMRVHNATETGNSRCTVCGATA